MANKPISISFAGRKFFLLIVLVVCVPGPWDSAQAYDWNNDYGADVRLGYDNNFRLTETNEVETSSTRIGVFASLEGSTETSSLQLRAGANATSYSESTIEDGDGYGVSVNAARRGERWSGNLAISADSQSTTETELLDTGNVIDGSRDTVSVSPGMRYQINERNSIFGSLSTADVTYDTVSFTEYTDNAASVGWGYRLDETSDLSLSVRTSEYDPVDAGTTDINSLSVGYTVSKSEATTYTFSVGYSEVDRPQQATETGNDLAIDISHQTDERNSFQFSLSNSYQASGAGEVRDEDRLSTSWSHALSERSQFNLTGLAGSNRDRDYASINVGSSYQYTREVALGASLGYRQQKIGCGRCGFH